MYNPLEANADCRLSPKSSEQANLRLVSSASVIEVELITIGDGRFEFGEQIK
jgi:hypothetical protein